MKNNLHHNHGNSQPISFPVNYGAGPSGLNSSHQITTDTGISQPSDSDESDDDDDDIAKPRSMLANYLANFDPYLSQSSQVLINVILSYKLYILCMLLTYILLAA